MTAETVIVTGMSPTSSPKSEEFVGRINSLKRRRISSDSEDDDTENVAPPTKQALLKPNYDSTSDSLQTSSPLLSGDEVFSSASYAENLDESFDDDSPGYFSALQDVSSPLNNVTNTSQTREQSKPTRRCPLPQLTWADSEDVWKRLCEREVISSDQRNEYMLDYHPSLKMRMRAILLDWLNEVCEAYKLHRETFHLAVNYIDRYLSNTKNVHKNRLQLIGISCLFIAAKVEEVYPPKITEFAYVTDGGCSVEEIKLEEKMIFRALDWRISPMTTNGWLNIFLQLGNTNAKRDPQQTGKTKVEGLRSYAFLFTQYSSLDFIICAQLIDLALLHVAVNRFKYSQLAAAAVAHIFSKEIASVVSGYLWSELEPCYKWLNPFARVLDEEFKKGEGVESTLMIPDVGNTSASGGLYHVCPNINSDQSHRFQIHNISLDFFDKVERYMSEEEDLAEIESKSEEQNTA